MSLYPQHLAGMVILVLGIWIKSIYTLIDSFNDSLYFIHSKIDVDIDIDTEQDIFEQRGCDTQEVYGYALIIINI